MKKSVTTFYLKIDKAKLDKVNWTKFTCNVEDQLFKFSTELEDFGNRYKDTENYVEKYLPISMQNTYG